MVGKDVYVHICQIVSTRQKSKANWDLRSYVAGDDALSFYWWAEIHVYVYVYVYRCMYASIYAGLYKTKKQTKLGHRFSSAA